MTFQVPTATSIKMSVFWGIAPCGLRDIGHRLRGPYCLHHQGNDLIMEAVSSSEPLVIIYRTKWCNKPEDRHL
jgi:hypothetical protein